MCIMDKYPTRNWKLSSYLISFFFPLDYTRKHVMHSRLAFSRLRSRRVSFMANVSQLQPAFVPQVETSSIESAEKDADFLALRLLNKRARVRLSPDPIDLSALPGKACLFAIANSKGWFAAIVRDASSSALTLSPLADLRSALESATSHDDQPYQPQRRVPVGSSTPTYVAFACNDTRLLLGLLDGSIFVYSTEHLFLSGDGFTNPMHTFPTTPSTILLSIQPNPVDIPELVAVLRDCAKSPGSLAVEILDVEKLTSAGGWVAGKSPSTTPTSISWSPKGKQLALGLQNGDIVTYSPTATATPKSSFPRPPSADSMSAICIQWLSTTSFHAIYAPPGQLAPDVEQLHFHVSLDPKKSIIQDVKFNSPYLPFPGLRPPGAFMVCLRSWDPFKALLFIGDGTSSDIGLIGSIADSTAESWHNLSLEETSTPGLPLDKDQNDTVMLGLDLDLTNASIYRYSTPSGESLELPSAPIMYAYASDGTITGWYLLNTAGKVYPGMTSAAIVSTVVSAPVDVARESLDMMTISMASPSVPMAAAPAVMQTLSSASDQSSIRAPQTPSLGQDGSIASPFGFTSQSSPAFGRYAFSQTTPTFGQSAFGQAQASTSAFGKPSFGGTPVASPLSAALPNGGGAFSAFASNTQSGFAAFALPRDGPVKPVWATGNSSKSAVSESVFGGAPTTNVFSELPGQAPSPFVQRTETSTREKSTPSLFTARESSIRGDESRSPSPVLVEQDEPVVPSTPTRSSAPVLTSDSPGDLKTGPTALYKPAAGFFGDMPKDSPFLQKHAMVPQSSPSAAMPAFGQSAFGQAQVSTSAFGKPSFGGTPVASPLSAALPNGGGAFSAFASNTQSGFAAFAPPRDGSGKPVWVTGSSSKSVAPKSVFGGAPTTNVFSELPGQAPSPFVQRTETSTREKSTPSLFTARESSIRGDESRSPSPVLVEQDEPVVPSTPTRSSAPVLTGNSSGDSETGLAALNKPAAGGFFGDMPKDSPFLQERAEVVEGATLVKGELEDETRSFLSDIPSESESEGHHPRHRKQRLQKSLCQHLPHLQTQFHVPVAHPKFRQSENSVLLPRVHL
ncbi:hypothetical protein F5I97DRAFT_1473825 [Phlebopus sp. FC_14]|nr:hypothetical protein F5I97DRAFT_1473825 [Phlebopus sp. FC_14]